MPKVLEASEIDQADELNTILTPEEEQELMKSFDVPADPGDLSDGGKVGGVTLTPMSGWGGVPLEEGRVAAIRAWSWNGTESMLTLAYNPEGTQHDYAMHYRRKRHCLCCQMGGFTISKRSPGCPNCRKIRCERCKASTDTVTVQTLPLGKKVKGWIIPNFYLRQEDVPYPARFYGTIPCFLGLCSRNGNQGFLTQQDMRVHARSRHRMEYQAYLEALEADKTDELTTLRQRLDAMQGVQVQAQPQKTASERTTRAWETRRRNERLKNQA